MHPRKLAARRNRVSSPPSVLNTIAPRWKAEWIGVLTHFRGPPATARETQFGRKRNTDHAMTRRILRACNRIFFKRKILKGEAVRMNCRLASMPNGILPSEYQDANRRIDKDARFLNFSTSEMSSFSHLSHNCHYTLFPLLVTKNSNTRKMKNWTLEIFRFSFYFYFIYITLYSRRGKNPGFSWFLRKFPDLQVSTSLCPLDDSR